MVERKLSKTEARQGETRSNLRYILAASMAAAIVALILVYLVV